MGWCAAGQYLAEESDEFGLGHLVQLVREGVGQLSHTRRRHPVQTKSVSLMNTALPSDRRRPVLETTPPKKILQARLQKRRRMPRLETRVLRWRIRTT